MNYRKYKLIIFNLSIFICCGMYVGAAQAQSASRRPCDPGRVPWADLSFQAKNFWVEVSTTVQLTSLPVSEVEARLLATTQGLPIKPTSLQVSQMTINTTIRPKFRSPVNLYNRVWFNPLDASALGRISLRRGEDDYKKIYRFTDQGVFRHQLEPKDKKEAALDPEKWTNIKDSFYRYDLPRLQCAEATEGSLLLYILSAADISTINESLSLCAFGKRQLHRVRFQQKGTYPLESNFIAKTPLNTMRREERINALKIAINAEPMESDLKEMESFSFLGLHDDIAIYLDPASRIPIEVSGIIPTIGAAYLRLSEVQAKFHSN